MAKRILVSFEGQSVPADQVDFEPEKEPWAVYKLEDGTVLRVKTIVGSVSRLVDRYKADGDPIYNIALGAVPVLEVPPELRQPASQQKVGGE